MANTVRASGDQSAAADLTARFFNYDAPNAKIQMLKRFLVTRGPAAITPLRVLRSFRVLIARGSQSYIVTRFARLFSKSKTKLNDNDHRKIEWSSVASTTASLHETSNQKHKDSRAVGTA